MRPKKKSVRGSAHGSVSSKHSIKVVETSVLESGNTEGVQGG